MKSVTDRIHDLLTASGGLTYDEVTHLNYLMHDKDHIMVKGAHDAVLDKAIRLLAKRPAKPLYRGISKEELVHVARSTGKGYAVPTYSSFSEDKDIAVDFAEGYGTKTVIELLPSAKGFCYWEWHRASLLKVKKDDPVEYEGSDGDFLIETLEAEAEWIFRRNMTFVVTDKRRERNILIYTVEARD